MQRPLRLLMADLFFNFTLRPCTAIQMFCAMLLLLVVVVLISPA